MDIVSTPTSLFYTDEFTKEKEFTPCEGEVEAVKWVPISESIEMIFKGIIVDSFSIIALLAYQTLKSRLK